MIWVIFAVLTGAAVLSVLWPLSRAPTATDVRDLDVAFYKAQTAEIDRDSARGLIGADDAETARTEAARRLMAATRQGEAKPVRVSPWGVRLAALGSLVFVPVLALVLYRQIGAPDLPDEPLQARLNAPPAKLDFAAAIAKIEQHLAKEPSDGRGWAVLAPIYEWLQRYGDAETAYRNAIRLLGPTAERYAALGETQVMAAGGMVSADAKASFESAQKIDPKSPRAGYYLGLAAEQDGDKPKAVALWQKLVADSPPSAAWVPLVRERIAAATGASPPAAAESGAVPNPPAGMAATVAKMSPDQQQAMIHSMVDRLASRLKTNGNDIDGWLRLVRAYRVLNEGDKAKVALTDARKNFAADPTATKRLDDLAHELGLEG